MNSSLYISLLVNLSLFSTLFWTQGWADDFAYVSKTSEEIRQTKQMMLGLSFEIQPYPQFNLQRARIEWDHYLTPSSHIGLVISEEKNFTDGLGVGLYLREFLGNSLYTTWAIDYTKTSPPEDFIKEGNPNDRPSYIGGRLEIGHDWIIGKNWGLGFSYGGVKYLVNLQSNQNEWMILFPTFRVTGNANYKDFKDINRKQRSKPSLLPVHKKKKKDSHDQSDSESTTPEQRIIEFD